MEDGFFDFSFVQCYNLGIFLSKEAPMPFTIRPAVATDREQIRPLQRKLPNFITPAGLIFSESKPAIFPQRNLRSA